MVVLDRQTDAATLRVQHRICGLTTGTLPGVSQQNVFLGLPLTMMPEEVVLLVQEGEHLAVLRT
jgi:tRNA-splicing endonuclease subunit Sen34